MAASNTTDKIAAQAIPGGAPSFDSPVPAQAITPSRAFRAGEVRPRIPKPRAISSQGPHPIESVGRQRHYTKRGRY